MAAYTCFCGDVYDDDDLKARQAHAWCDYQPAAEMAEGAGGQRDTDPCPPPVMDSSPDVEAASSNTSASADYRLRRTMARAEERRLRGHDRG
jgi:hypothetical protein